MLSRSFASTAAEQSSNVALKKLESRLIGVAVPSGLQFRLPDSLSAVDTRAHVVAARRRGEALAEFERAMRVGGSDRVRKHQEALAKHGYYRGAVDGPYGPQSRASLVACLKAGCRLLE